MSDTRKMWVGKMTDKQALDSLGPVSIDAEILSLEFLEILYTNRQRLLTQFPKFVTKIFHEDEHAAPV